MFKKGMKISISWHCQTLLAWLSKISMWLVHWSFSESELHHRLATMGLDFLQDSFPALCGDAHEWIWHFICAKCSIPPYGNCQPHLLLINFWKLILVAIHVKLGFFPPSFFASVTGESYIQTDQFYVYRCLTFHWREDIYQYFNWMILGKKSSNANSREWSPCWFWCCKLTYPD